MTIRTLTKATLLLATGLVVGCTDGGPTSPGEPLVLDQEAAFAGLPPGAVLAAANGTGPEESGVILDVSFPGQICGIPVIISMFRTGAAFGDLFGQPADEAGSLLITYTNPANGHSVEYHRTGLITRELLDSGVLDSGEFWIEVREDYRGLRGKINASGGPVRATSAGRIVVDLRVIFLEGGGFTVELLGMPFLAGFEDPASHFESPEQCAIMEDILL